MVHDVNECCCSTTSCRKAIYLLCQLHTTWIIWGDRYRSEVWDTFRKTNVGNCWYNSMMPCFGKAANWERLITTVRYNGIKCKRAVLNQPMWLQPRLQSYTHTHTPAYLRCTSKSSIYLTLADTNAESLCKYLVTSSLSYSASNISKVCVN